MNTPVDEGLTTSPALMAMLRAGVAKRYPGMVIGGLDKVGVLEAVRAEHGWRAVFELGEEVRCLSEHPVVRALVAVAAPRTIVERWKSLERFGHSRNRTRVLVDRHDEPAPSLSLQHVALDGGPIGSVNDLFIWGLLVSLLEAAGVVGVAAMLTPRRGQPFVLYGKDASPTSRPLPKKTDVLTLWWTGAKSAPPSSRDTTAPADATASAGERLRKLLAVDLLRQWTVEAAARALSTSPRSMQRALHAEGTTFSGSVQRVRLEAARELLVAPRLALTEVAFCTGFADQAHFTRTFRKHHDIPPSALRDMLTIVTPGSARNER